MSVRTRLRLVLEYDGTEFHGWQVQRGVRTVEGCLREALGRLGGEVVTYGASRTDAGVHALGQCALAELDTRLEVTALARALPALTPPDLRIVECRAAAPDFHPRHAALEKRYLYRVHCAPTAPALGGRYQWWWRQPLDLTTLQHGTTAIIGEHDFAAFRNHSDDGPETSVRRVRTAAWHRDGCDLFFQVVGDGFLYRMVRNLVGTLLEVGRGHWPPERVAEVLAGRDRALAGPTAPAHGLFLMEVAYADTEPCRLSSQPPRF